MNIFIDTDFEPDDALAIKEIFNMRDEEENGSLTVCVGESVYPAKKLAEVQAFIDALQYSHRNPFPVVTIFAGLPSTQDYPYAPQQGDHPITNDALTLHAQHMATAELYFLFKPPRELMANTDLDLKHVRAMAYGGFNFRTLGLSTAEMQGFMTRFDLFYYFDSFSTVGSNNSHNFRPHPIGGPVNHMIVNLITRWNTHVIEDCQLDEKIIASGLHSQFVLADVCVVMSPSAPSVPVRLVQVDPYPTWERDENSTIFVFMDGEEEKKQRREFIVGSC